MPLNAFAIFIASYYQNKIIFLQEYFYELLRTEELLFVLRRHIFLILQITFSANARHCCNYNARHIPSFVDTGCRGQKSRINYYTFFSLSLLLTHSPIMALSFRVCSSTCFEHLMRMRCHHITFILFYYG